jgi:hypothetical protein
LREGHRTTNVEITDLAGERRRRNSVPELDQR